MSKGQTSYKPHNFTECPKCGHPRIYTDSQYPVIDGVKYRILHCGSYTCNHTWKSPMEPRDLKSEIDLIDRQIEKLQDKRNKLCLQLNIMS